MAKTAVGYPDDDEHYEPRGPATTPEGRESEIIAAAYDLAEQQIKDGTASAQVISHFLKMGSTRERQELTLLSAKTSLELAKVEQLASEARVEVLYEEAIKAMRSYAGQETADDEEDDYDDY